MYDYFKVQSVLRRYVLSLMLIRYAYLIYARYPSERLPYQLTQSPGSLPTSPSSLIIKPPPQLKFRMHNLPLQDRILYNPLAMLRPYTR